MKLRSRKGFTLAELLIVMAIIVVLAAVAIPSFTRQLETSRETADLETLRNAYTDAYTAALADVSAKGGLYAEADARTVGNVTATKGADNTKATYQVTGLSFVQAGAGFEYVGGSIDNVEVSTLTGLVATQGYTKVTFSFVIDEGAITLASTNPITFAA